MYKKIALFFLFFSGKSFCMLVNPVRETWDDQLFMQKLIPNGLPDIMNHLDFRSNALLLMTCKGLYQIYGDKGFDLSPQDYTKEMIHISRLCNKQQVQLLIDREADVHKRQRESLLHYFKIKHWNLNTIMSIYKKEYDSKCEDFAKLKTEIKFEDIVRNPVLCQLLLEQGLSPNICYNNDTLLICAVLEGNSEVVKVLLNDKRTDPNKGDNKEGRTPLHWAINARNLEAIKFLISHEKIEPNKKNRNSFTPLHSAIESDLGIATEAIALLLGHPKINPNEKNQYNKKGYTSFHWAVIRGKLEQTKLLLDYAEIDPHAKGDDGQTPLHDAIILGNLEVIKFLLGHERIDPNEKNGKGQTPFQYAILSKKAKAIELLLDNAKFDPDKEDNDGHTSLLCAANNWAPNVKIVERLLDKSNCTNFFWYNFHRYESSNRSIDMLPLLSKCTSYTSRFFYWCGYTAGFLRRKTGWWEANSAISVIGDVAVTGLSSAALVVLYCMARSSSSSSSDKEKSKDSKNKNSYSHCGVGQFGNKTSFATGLGKF